MIQPNTANENGTIHCASTGHKFLNGQTKILASEPHHVCRKIREGIHIFNCRSRDRRELERYSEGPIPSLNLPSPVYRVVYVTVKFFHFVSVCAFVRPLVAQNF